MDIDVSNQLKNLQGEERTCSVLSNLDALYWELDIATEKFSFSSIKLLLNYGYTKDDVPRTASEFISLVHVDDVEKVDKLLNRYLSGEGKSYSVKYRFKIKPEGYVWFHDTVKGIEFDEKGSLTILAGITIDISDSIEYESEFTRSQSRMRALFDAIPAGISLISKTGETLEANIISEKLLGISIDEHKNRNLNSDKWKIIDSDGEIMKLESLPATRALSGEGIIRDVEMGIVKEDTITWISTSAAPVNSDAEGGVAVVFVDITERKKAQEELKKTIKVLEMTQNQLLISEKMALIGSLVAGVAHEIGSPLGTAITTASYINTLCLNLTELYKSQLLKKVNMDNFLMDFKKASLLMDSCLERTAELIDNFKKISVDYHSISSRKFDLVSFLNQLMITFEHELKRGNHMIYLDNKEPIYVTGNPGDYAQIFSNLIFNSIIHGFDSHEGGKIEINITTDVNSLRIDFKDDGIGIPDELYDNIFEPFFTTNLNAGLSGLGLSVVQNIVQQKLMGDIYCAEDLEKGTLFIINIPL